MFAKRRNNRRSTDRRRGAVTVEFAFMAPVLITVCFGMAELSKLMQIRKDMSIAVREGARIATMDRREFNHSQESTNAKIEADIRAILDANGLPADEMTIEIMSIPESENETAVVFDLDDPDNDEEFFSIRIQYAAADLLAFPLPDSQVFTIGAQIVFRNGRAQTVQ